MQLLLQNPYLIQAYHLQPKVDKQAHLWRLLIDLLQTVFRSVGVHEADAELSDDSDEHAVKEATSNRAEKTTFIFFCMKVPFYLLIAGMNYLIKYQMN